MFTPPPSPLPTAASTFPSVSSENAKLSITLDQQAITEAKKRTSKRFRLAVLSFPIALILLTLGANHLIHGTINTPPSSWGRILFSSSFEWSGQLHRRVPQPDPQASAPSSSRTPLPIASQSLPTVPSAPPVLPTPFPQPFDTSITQNFSSTTCLNFFTNMTNSAPFRTCRPFSMLLQTSSALINAQSNLTLLNSIIWGTCNANADFGQCKSNMGWFSNNIKTACAADLQAQSITAVGTLVALQSFQVMHDAACLEDPTTDSYCYVNAARNSNPADLYYYQLPLGIRLPQTSTPSCSACSRSLMSLYSAALADPGQAAGLSALKAAYDPSVQLSAQFCGAGFAALTNAGVNIGVPTLGRMWVWMGFGLLLVLGVS